ncbi:MAG: M14 family metallopeptidase [Planctomycetaceae bacterium]|nr:M14 family metallopeptidase [Planctomycetaceae bacterium]
MLTPTIDARRQLPCLVALCLLTCQAPGQDAPVRQLQTVYEQGDGNQTATYEQTIAFYTKLADGSPRVSMHQMGPTDSGHPLHLVILADPPVPKLSDVPTDGRGILLINNAIHPGESDGVDASMMLARDLAADPTPLSNVIVAIIPMYNIGGALNRNSTTRANQNGPKAYGFRGNARNLDLNRDFIKCDSLNARSFARIFHTLDPDLFLDTHVSNGADYQHVMTTAHSQKDKLGQQLGGYLQNTFQPALFGRMKQSGFPTVPYVNSGGAPPDRGFSQFLESPRYSTGYTALFQTFGFMTETHMLKPYHQRVTATRAFLDHTIALLSREAPTLRRLRTEDRKQYCRRTTVPIAWQLDRSVASRLEFHGYEASRPDSLVTVGQRLFYDRSQPFVREVPFYDSYRPSRSVTLPAGYLIPQGWHTVIALMELNGVKLHRVTAATKLSAETYTIDEASSRTAPYEGHYFHDDVSVSSTRGEITAAVGDVIIPIRQPAARYVVETLEPEAMDSLFRWNFFDTILQRKEHFSPYVFEEVAAELLANDPQLRQEFEQRQQDDESFAGSRSAQLQFIYERSPHNEPAYRRYPVRRLLALPAAAQGPHF